jgi:biopolymer transport protein ExbD
MPKVKIKRKSTLVDMTAMCDVAFLLLTFFILTSKFRPQDPVEITMPASVSERKIADSDIMIMQIDKEGRTFLGADNQGVRGRALQIMLKSPYYAPLASKFSAESIEVFKKTESFGAPFVLLPDILSGKIANDGKHTTGLPVDSLKSPVRRNELGDWLQAYRQAHLELANEKAGGNLDMKSYNYIRLAIKGDGLTEYPEVEKIFNTLKDRAINKFDLITNMKGGETASKGGGEH